jgi:glyoxylase-like metal-dependent hydrolase (beta-lactamase superfamily II)
MRKNQLETSRNSYHFNLGDLECMVVSDGTNFKPEIKTDIDTLSLLVRTKAHTVLIDTGWGIGMQPDTGKLIQNLQVAGIQCRDVDTVIFSHGHVDHIGGNTDAHRRPAFPNARYVMYRKEWEYWTSEHEFTPEEQSIRQLILASVQKNLIPIKDRFDLVEDETEIVPGITFFKSPGHSPGQIVLVISSGTEQLLYTGDVFHHPSELGRSDLDWVSNSIPEEIRKTRNQLISLAAAPNTLFFASHFPFPGVGHIVQKDNVWSWEPL